MGKWSQQLMAGVDILIKLDADVKGAFPNLQGFVQASDTAEKTDLELLDLHKDIVETRKKIEALQTELKSLEGKKAAKLKVLDQYCGQISKQMESYDRAIGNFEKMAKTTGEKEFNTAAQAIKGGLRRYDAFIDLKKRIYIEPGDL